MKTLLTSLMLAAFALAASLRADQTPGWIRLEGNPDEKGQLRLVISKEATARQQSRVSTTSMSQLKTESLLSGAAMVSGAAVVAGGNEADQITPEIQSLANGLLNNWQNIFNWVRRNVDYQHYYGARKGAHMTLLERSGNDVDQCALLTALLRASGFQAGYLSRVWLMPWKAADKCDLSNWLNIEPSQWPLLASSRAMPANQWADGADYGYPGNLVILRMAVKATLDGQVQVLDPSFKMYEKVAGINVPAATQFTAATALNVTGGTTTATAVSGLNIPGLNNYLDGLCGTLGNSIRAQRPNGDGLSAIGGYRIAQTQSPYLTPFNYFTGNDLYYDALPATLFSTLKFTSPTGLNYTLNLPGLAGKRLSLEYDGANRLRLFRDDTATAAESTIGAGNVEVTITATHPGSGGSAPLVQSETKVYTRGPAQRYVIVCGFHSGADLIKARQRVLDSYRRSGLADSSREVILESLNLIALNWLRESELAANAIASLSGVTRLWHHRIGRVAQEVLSTKISFYIDVGLQHAAYCGRAATVDANPSFLAETLAFSAMEHGVISQLQGGSAMAASTVELLKQSSTDVIYRATPANWATVKGSLVNYSAADLNTIAAVMAGSASNWVLLPRNGKIVINSWSGVGYVTWSVSGANTGCGMLISGGLFGGHSVTGSALSPSKVVLSYSSGKTYSSGQPIVTVPVKGGDPVDMATGQYTSSSTDLTLGAALPRGLAFSRNYHGAMRYQKEANLGYGWNHNLNCKLVENSNYEDTLGMGSAQEAAIGLMGASALLELCRDVSTAKKGAVASLAAHWLMTRLQQNAISLSMGERTFEFSRRADGSFASPRGSTLTLGKNAQGLFEIKERNANTLRFDAQNRLWQIDDLWGKRATFTYDTAGRLSQVADAYGRAFTFAYNTAGQLTTVSDVANARTVTFAYNTAGDLISATDPEGKRNFYDYDSAHRLIREKDHDQRIIVENTVFDGLDRVLQQRSQGLVERTWKFYYSPGLTIEEDPKVGRKGHLFDSMGRPNGEIDAFNRLWKVEYDGEDHVVRTVSPSGSETLRTYDANHNLTATRDEDGFWERFIYDAQNRVTTHTDRNGKNTTYTYNATHQPLTVTNPAGEVTTMTYDAAGNLRSLQPPNGSATTYSYTALDQLSRIDSPGGGAQTTSYNGLGDPSSVTDARGNATSFAYNKRRELLSTTAPGNLVSTNSYDNARNLAATTNPRGKTTAMSYSSTRKLLATTLPGGATISTSYDVRDWAERITDPMGFSTSTLFAPDGKPQTVTDPLGRRSSNGFDFDRRIVVQVSPMGFATYAELDKRGNTIATQDGTGSVAANGNANFASDAESRATRSSFNGTGARTSFTNRRGGRWLFTLDAVDRLTATTSPSGRVWRQAYNNRGLLGTVTEPSGESLALSYDAKGRLTQKAGSSYTTAYSYDANDNLLGVTEGGQSLTRSYDALDRVSSYTNAAGETIGYAYDANGNLAKLTYPDGKTASYGYDDRDRLISVTDWAGRVTSFSWDANSRLTRISRPNGTVRNVSYDAGGQLTRVEERQPNGRLISMQQFGYDLNGRITSRFTAPVPQVGPEPGLSAAYDADDRMTSHNGQALGYDADGNLLGGPLPDGPWGANKNSLNATGSFTWDARNRLAAVTRADTGEVVSYAYDAEGFLVGITAGGQTERLTVDPHGGKRSQVLVRTAADGAVTRYVYGLGLLYEERSGGVQRYYHYDHLGSTVALTDSAGQVTGRARYTTFGTLAASEGEILKSAFLWHGQHGVWTDPGTGLHQMRARWYSNRLCRFLNPDPAGFAGGSNFYLYANGDPVSMIDPFGLGAERAMGLVANVFGKGLSYVSSAARGLVNAGINDLRWTGEQIQQTARIIDEYGGKRVFGDVGVLGFAESVGMMSGASLGRIGSAARMETVGARNAPRVFWSGGDSARQAAEAFAKANGGTTLEMTAVGQRLQQTTKGLDWLTEAKPMWEAASADFARGATGPVHVFQNGSRGVSLESVWRGTEFPLLKQQGNPINYHVVMPNGVVPVR